MIEALLVEWDYTALAYQQSMRSYHFSEGQKRKEWEERARFFSDEMDRIENEIKGAISSKIAQDIDERAP